jgi:excisionase family DNA binding protein
MRLLSIRRLADELAVSERHIREMIAQGLWPIYRVGKRRIRLDLEEIKKLCRLSAREERE